MPLGAYLKYEIYCEIKASNKASLKCTLWASFSRRNCFGNAKSLSLERIKLVEAAEILSQNSLMPFRGVRRGGKANDFLIIFRHSRGTFNKFPPGIRHWHSDIIVCVRVGRGWRNYAKAELEWKSITWAALWHLEVTRQLQTNRILSRPEACHRVHKLIDFGAWEARIKLEKFFSVIRMQLAVERQLPLINRISLSSHVCLVCWSLLNHSRVSVSTCN